MLHILTYLLRTAKQVLPRTIDGVTEKSIGAQAGFEPTARKWNYFAHARLDFTFKKYFN